MSKKAPPLVAFAQHLVSRGEEISSTDPIVAYFCYYYAVRQVLETKLHSSDTAVAEFATALLNKIETLKGSCPDQDLLDDDDASRAHVLNFALAVFERADQATRSQQVTKATGAGFAAAATFLGLEGIWGEIDMETKEKIKYAKFQATRILKSIKEGKNPNDLFPPVSNEEVEEAVTSQDEIEGDQKGTNDPVESKVRKDAKDEDAEDEVAKDKVLDSSSSHGDSEDIELPAPPRVDPKDDLILPHAPKESLSEDLSLPPPPESKPEGNVSPPPPPPKQPNSSDSTRQAHQSKEASRHPVSPTLTANNVKARSSSRSSNTVSPQEIIALTKVTSSAQKHTKYAMSALNYEDIATAISELEQALSLLRTHQSDF